MASGITVIEPEKIIGREYSNIQYKLTDLDAILYSYSIGFSEDPLKIQDFEFTYENDPRFQFFPTFSAAFGLRDFEGLINQPFLKSINTNMILHGEEDVEIKKPLELNKTYQIVSRIADLQDKGKLSIIVCEKDVQDMESKEKYSKVTSRIVVRGMGNYGGGKGKLVSEFPTKPERNPDQITDQKIHKNQAILYRLNGDRNPLHIDPSESKKGGFDVPILHGLCTYGVSAKAVYQQFCNENPEMIKRVSSRFTSHVFPGETLSVSMWKTEENKVYYETSIKERNVVALKGFMELNKSGFGGGFKKGGVNSSINKFARVFRKIL